MIQKHLACTDELIDFEKAVIDFGKRLDDDIRRLQCVISWNGLGIMDEDTLLGIYDTLTSEARILREKQRQRAGALLLSAVDVSRRVIAVEKAYRGEE